MIVAERSRTGSHRWENDWCPKCKERMTFWYVAESRTRCAQCATEKDKSLGLGLGPDAEEEEPPIAPPTIELTAEDLAEMVLLEMEPQVALVIDAPEAAAEEVPIPEPPAAEPAAAPPAPEPVVEDPQEPAWVLHWCPQCSTNASFRPGTGRYHSCMGCGHTCEIPQANRGLPRWQGPA